MKSLIIPVYKNESGLTALLEALEAKAAALGDGGLARRLGALTMPVPPERFSFPTQRV